MQKDRPFSLTSHRAALVAALFVGSALVPATPHRALADDGIFPPAPAAKPFVDFDGQGFLIRGQRTFIASGSLHYSRVPRALWRDRLLRFKRAGFNTVQTYVYWDVHEPQEGKFNFSGDADLDAYLKLIKSLGMYAVVRVGPYYCAEWDSGGYPIWLRFKPGIRVREHNPEFEAAVDHFWDKLLPIVAANQIHRGGSVIMVQLENEHPQGWGKDIPNAYFQHLRDKALALGVEVPYFFSGLHHGSDPAGRTPWDSVGRTNPWYTTEFWPGWFSEYGPLSAGDLRRFDRGTWKILAYGGNGYNFYMLHGGSNFDYFNDNEDAASYDYSAAVGQAGDLRPIYFRFKRATYFAQSFPEILEHSTNATAAYAQAATNSDVHVTARHSAAGSIVFLDNPGDTAAQTRITADGVSLPTSAPLTLEPGEILPIVRDCPIAPGVTLQWAPTRILGIVPQGKITTVVIYGQPGTPAELHFDTTQPAKIAAASSALTATAQGVALQTTFPAADPATSSFTVGGRTIRVVALSNARADQTWFVRAGDDNYIVSGPDFVGDATVDHGKLHFTTEERWENGSAFATEIYGPSDRVQQIPALATLTQQPSAPTIDSWQVQDAGLPAETGFADSAWMSSAQPLPMGADGDVSAFAWYRASVSVPQPATYTLKTGGAGDRMSVYVDGNPVSGSLLNLSAGPHTLAVFTAHDGRDKLYGYLGPIDKKDIKGLRGPVTLLQPKEGGAITLSDWRMIKAERQEDAAQGPPPATAASWQSYTVGRDAFDRKRGFAWFQTTIANLPSAPRRTLHFGGVDDNATVFIDGKQVAHHEGWNEPFDVPLDPSAGTNGPIQVSVFVENTDGTGGISQPVDAAAYSLAILVSGWRMHGGPGDPLAESGWSALPASGDYNRPQFFRTTFTAAPPSAIGNHPIWRIVPAGLSHGSVWVNGHNLGRYPERVPVNGLYVPECWLQPGKNSLVVFDEAGSRPDKVTIVAETAASRNVASVDTVP